jgi:hypothetical protein
MERSIPNQNPRVSNQKNADPNQPSRSAGKERRLGLRWHDTALVRRDTSRRWKARMCPRTPKFKVSGRDFYFTIHQIQFVWLWDVFPA